MTATRLLGIDPGSLLAGYACIQVASPTRLHLMEAGVLRLARGESLAYRLRQLDEDLTAVIDQFRPSRVVVEKIFAHPAHPLSALVIAHARGVVLLAAQRAGLPITEVTPAEVKKSLTGNGRATKQQMQRAVAARCGLAKPPSPADVADAIAIALCGATR